MCLLKFQRYNRPIHGGYSRARVAFAPGAWPVNNGLIFYRLFAALKTPYLPNGKFDLEAYDALVANQISNGVEGVIVGGTTGEGQLMGWDEHIMLIAHTVNQFGRDIKVIGNTGSNSTGEALHATEQGFGVGMHAALHINPYYGKTSIAGLKAHFKAVLEEGPAMIYNVPGRTSQDIPEDVVFELNSHPHFLGVKECTGNARIGSYTKNGVTCWSGNDDEAHGSRHNHGAQGVVSVTSNLIPGIFSSLMQTQDDAKAESLQELIAWLFCEPNPIPVCVHENNFCSYVSRMRITCIVSMQEYRNGHVRPCKASVQTPVRASFQGTEAARCRASERCCR